MNGIFDSYNIGSDIVLCGCVCLLVFYVGWDYFEWIVNVLNVLLIKIWLLEDCYVDVLVGEVVLCGYLVLIVCVLCFVIDLNWVEIDFDLVIVGGLCVMIVCFFVWVCGGLGLVFDCFGMIGWLWKGCLLVSDFVVWIVILYCFYYWVLNDMLVVI